MPFTLLVAAAVGDHAREVEDADRSSRAPRSWLGLAVLTRPETPVIAAAPRARPAREDDGHDLVEVDGVSSPSSFPSCSSALYFGDWLPNTLLREDRRAPSPSARRSVVDYVRKARPSLVPAFGAAGRS
jgi:hypothetical protein